GPSELTRFSPPPFSPDTRLLMTLSTRLCGGRGVGVRGDSDERATMASNPDQKQRARQLRRDLRPAEKASDCRVSSEGIPNYEGAANPRGAAPVRSVVGSMSFRCGSFSFFRAFTNGLPEFLLGQAFSFLDALSGTIQQRLKARGPSQYQTLQVIIIV